MSWADWLALPLALGLAATFIASALPKLRHPKGFVFAVMNYRVLPDTLSIPYGWLLPPLELGLALTLLFGIALPWAALALGMLLVSFIVAVGINLGRGNDIPCNCFGNNRGTTRPISRTLVLQDAGLLLGALALAGLSWGHPGLMPWSPLAFTRLARVPALALVGLPLALTVGIVGVQWRRALRSNRKWLATQAR